MKKYKLTIAAISCHGNPVHPQKDIANKFHEEFEDAVLLAEKLGVDTVVTFSGCPGDQEGAKYPNWVTCAWPEDYVKILDYQWNEVLIPYWKKTVDFCKYHGVNKIALEMHPGFAVYNPSSAIKALSGAIHHFHAKDTKIDYRNTDVNGVLDSTHYGEVLNRSWVLRTVGYGHDKEVWNDIISTLKATGYDGAISIEHEDSLM